MYNISIIVDKNNHTDINLHKTDIINYNFITSRFVEGNDFIGLYLSHSLGTPDFDKLIIEVGRTASDITYYPSFTSRELKPIETTHLFLWDHTGYVKRVTIENGLIHYHKDHAIISEYPITTGARIECLQTVRTLTKYDISKQISIRDSDETDNGNQGY
jgi:hypothetical protein